VPQTTLRDAHGIKTVRRTLAEIDAASTIGKDGLLTVGDEIASVVYFRAGCARATLAGGVVLAFSDACFFIPFRYTPVDFPTDAEWRGRAVIERSACVKCPSLG